MPFDGAASGSPVEKPIKLRPRRRTTEEGGTNEVDRDAEKGSVTIGKGLCGIGMTNSASEDVPR